MKKSLMLVFTIVLTHLALAQPGLPELLYQAPPNFYRSAFAPPEDYSATDINVGFQIYHFRSFTGDIELAFRRNLLREWIDPRFQENNVAVPPEFRPMNIAGAQYVISARFVENVAGMPKQRQRMLIVAGDAAAILEASASSMAAWQQALPRLSAFLATLRVESGAPAPQVPATVGAEGRVIAGLYGGMRKSYIPDLNRPVGQGSLVMTPHYYLFSADGRVYRAFNEIPLPGGIERFDFNAAQRIDPENTGRYVVRGDQLLIRMGAGQGAETITTTLPQHGRLTIDKVIYDRE